MHIDYWYWNQERFIFHYKFINIWLHIISSMPESIETAEADEINMNASNITNKAAVCKERHECVKTHKWNDILNDAKDVVKPKVDKIDILNRHF